MNKKINTKTPLPTETEYKPKRSTSITRFRQRCRQMLDSTRQHTIIRSVSFKLFFIINFISRDLFFSIRINIRRIFEFK
jgi:hypothetical protein